MLAEVHSICKLIHYKEDNLNYIMCIIKERNLIYLVLFLRYLHNVG